MSNTVYEDCEQSKFHTNGSRKSRRSLLYQRNSCASLKRATTPSPKRVQFVNDRPFNDITNLSPRINRDIIEIKSIEKISPSRVKTIFNSMLSITDGLIVKSRNWRMRQWKCTFLGHQLVDWLVQNSFVSNREEGIDISNEMIKNGWIDHPAKFDEFRDSKDIFYLTNSARVTRRDLLIPTFMTIFHPKNGLYIKDHQGLLKKHRDCFTGTEFVDFILRINLTAERVRAEYIGKAFLEYNLIEHISQDCNFKDSPILYQITRRGGVHLNKVSSSKLKRNKTELVQKDKKVLQRRSSASTLSLYRQDEDQESIDSESSSSKIDSMKIQISALSPKQRAVEQFKSSFNRWQNLSLSNDAARPNVDVMSSPHLLQPEILNDQLHRLFLMEFCNAVANFKVTYLERSPQEHLADVDQLLQKFFKQSYVGVKLSSQIDSTLFDEVMQTKYFGTIQLDIFDKLLNQIITLLNKSNTPNTTTPPTSARWKPAPKRVSSKRILKNNTSTDPENQTPPITVRERTLEVPEAIIIRRFSQNRGGVKVIVPDSLEKLLALCSEKLKVKVACLREPSTEAAITDLSLLTQDMILWATTDEEETLFQ